MYCPFCGNKAGNEDIYCGNCGKKVQSTEDPSRQTRHRQAPRSRIGWVLFAILLIGGVIGGIVFYQSKSTTPIVKEIVSASPKENTIVKKQELKDIINQVQKSVVKIEVPSQGVSGSGFLYNHKGDIITNAHVVAGAQMVTVKLNDMKEYDGEVIGISDETDVAVVRVNELRDHKPLQIDQTHYSEMGDKILALGSPLGLQNTVTTGIISGVHRDFTLDPYVYENAYQISAPIAHGNSGGPLVKEETGEAIGINSAGTEEGSIGFSIPLVNILDLVQGWSQSPMIINAESSPSDDYSGEDEEEDADDEETEDQYSLQEVAEQVLADFYSLVDSRDYDLAYDYLGMKWQSHTSLQQFANGYEHTLAVRVDHLETTDVQGEYVVIDLYITADEEKGGSERTRQYHLTYKVGLEDGDVKILAGKGKSI
ncbi:trypsin-like peptidase domain-containing protein [Priestia koreensis]|uniref:trypsin-like peptidase domain-containing protein n=1 Tax=Priestia koreensis TaxID=284581 RepID=UPI0034575E72